LLNLLLMKRLLSVVLFLPLFAGAQSLKNLDVKNGFLQFHLGDSVSKYKNDIYIPWKNHPDQNEVKQSALGDYKKMIEKVTLVNVDGIITEIDVFIIKEEAEAYFDKLMMQYYGKGVETPNLDKYQQGTHLTYTTWKGERVTAMILQTNLNRPNGKTMLHARIQSIVFTLANDKKVDGALPDNFLL
jgi:hypothetical protein